MTEMPFKPGRILLVHYPFTDSSAAKVRPVLVVSRLEFNRGEDVVVVPISSRIVKDDRYGFPIFDTDACFSATKLKRSSTVKWSKPMTINRSVVGRKLGIIPRDMMRQIADNVRGLF